MVGESSPPDVLLDVVFRTVETGLCLLGPDGRVVRVNEAWVRACGLEETGLVGKLYADLAPAPELVEALREAQAGAIGVAVPLPPRSLIGGEMRAESATPVPLAGGTGLLLAVKDGGPPAQAWEEWRALQSALEALPVGILMVEAGADDRVRAIGQNLTHERAVGSRLRKDQNADEARYQLFHPDRVTPFPPHERPGARAVLSGEPVRNVVVHALRPDGEWRILEASAEPLNVRQGAPRRAVVATIDVSEKVRAQEEVRRRESTYRAMARNLRDAVALLTPVRDAAGQVKDWRFLDVNEGMERILNKPVGELLGRGLGELHPERLAAVSTGFERVLLGGEPWRYEIRAGSVHLIVTVFRVDEDKIGSAAMDVSDLKSTEASLRRSEMQLRQLVEHTPVGIALLDREMHHLAVSRRFAHDYRVEMSALLGKSHYEVFPNLPERWREVHRRCLEGASARSEEDVYIHADGSKDWFSWEIQPWRESDGSVGGLVLFAANITERKLAQDRLAAAKERLAVTLASIGDAVVATDEREMVTLVNDVAAKLIGRPAEQAIGRPLHEIFPIVNEDTGAEVESPTTRVLREGVVVGLANHTVLVSHDGSRRPIADSAAPIRDADGAISGVVLVFRDQTEERRAEAALLRSRAEFKALVEKLPIGVFVTKEGRIVYANPVFASWVGYARAEELAGRQPQELTHPGALPAVPLPGKEWTVRGAEGRPVALECSSVRAVDFEGLPALLFTCRDLRELKEMQAQVLQNDRMATLGMLAAGVAHEINNPLTYVISSLDLLRERLTPLPAELGAEERAELVAFAADAMHGAQRVQAIVRDLRAFSKPERDDAKRLDLAQVLDSAIGMVANQIGHRARLVRDYLPAPAIVASEARLGQVFINLLVNAAQAIGEGRRDDNEIRVRLETDQAGRAVVEVSDTGAGIPAQVMERVFDPFFTTKGAAGTGLGLSISRNTVAALGGEIRLSSTEGRGTTARVILPTAALPEATSVSGPSRTVGHRRAKVLVVDDEPRICWTLRRALQSDHDVIVEERAEAARARLAAGERFDVVFCDIMMPGMTGIDLYHATASLAPDQAERFVFITGGTFTKAAEDFLESVPNLRLGKPFDLQELRSLVNRAVR